MDTALRVEEDSLRWKVFNDKQKANILFSFRVRATTLCYLQKNFSLKIDMSRDVKKKMKKMRPKLGVLI